MPVETFSTPGILVWPCPANVASLDVECFGSGGRGAGGGDGGRGSGGGAYSKSVISVTPGNNYDLNIGFGGGVEGSAGDDGEETNFHNGLVVAAGGKKGSTTGLGGSADDCVGDIKFSGGNGANAVGLIGGGGGSSAGSSGNGENASGQSGGFNLTGGSGGDGGDDTDGNNGNSPGGGAGGGGDGFIGGLGGNGKVVLTYTTSSNTPKNKSVRLGLKLGL